MKHVKRTIRQLIGLALVIWLVWFVATRWDQVLAASALEPGYWVVAFLAASLALLTQAMVQGRLLSAQGVHIKFTTMTALATGSVVLNYVPMRLGSIMKANYLRRQRDLPYSAFVVIMAAQPLLTLTAACIAFVLAATTLEFSRDVWMVVAAAVAISSTAVAMGLLNGWMKRFKWVRGMLAVALDAWHAILMRPRVLAVVFALVLLRIALQAVRLTLFLGVLQYPVGWWEVFLIAAAGEVGMAGPFTPNGIGQREAMIAGVALSLGISAGPIGAAAAIDRCVMILASVAIGGVPAWWMWRETTNARTGAGESERSGDEHEMMSTSQLELEGQASAGVITERKVGS